MTFKDRVDARRRLSQALISYKGQDTVVYALPRGGVVVGAEIARALDAPLDLIIVRKIGHRAMIADSSLTVDQGEIVP
jgi:putative phosphoribosyl transferase